MAKKEFTDITIKICQRKCNFKRVTNETLTKFADKAEKEYEDKVKAFVDEVDRLDNKRQFIESQLKVKYKLVRDNIPDIINKDPKSKIIKSHKIKDDKIFKIELLEKLNEESDELKKAMINNDGNIVEELADIKTVLDTIIEVNELSWEEIEKVKQKKDTERGRFDDKIFLQYVETYK